VTGDSAQLQQVVMDLVANAAESLGDGRGTIIVRTEHEPSGGAHDGDGRHPGLVVIEVVDDGSGIDEAIRPRIFDPFFTTKFVGRGLGLAAALGVVHSHQGAIEVISAPGVGTTMRVSLPVQQAATAPSSIEPTPRPRTRERARPGSPTVVMIVDDEQGIRRIARVVLEPSGYTVIEANDGAAAVELYRLRRDVSLVLLDLSMPGLSGEHTCRELLGIDPAAVIIVMSGHSEQEAFERLQGLTVSGFLHKPFDIEVLEEAVAEAIGG
jgi:CheY-like chemotaxis protein